jgi:hypothetical protein
MVELPYVSLSFIYFLWMRWNCIRNLFWWFVHDLSHCAVKICFSNETLSGHYAGVAAGDLNSPLHVGAFSSEKGCVVIAIWFTIQVQVIHGRRLSSNLEVRCCTGLTLRDWTLIYGIDTCALHADCVLTLHVTRIVAWSTRPIIILHSCSIIVVWLSLSGI